MMKAKVLLRSTLLWVIASTAAAPACNMVTTSPSETGTLNLQLTDSPFSDAKALLVTFSSVSVHASGGDFKTLPFGDGAASRTCDLKQLAGAQDVLGTGSLATGHYTEVRLVVSSATIYFDLAASGAPCAPTISGLTGRTAPVTIPSGEVRLNREFDVTSNTTTTMVLDFDGDQSVKSTGNGTYMMTPVISVLNVQ